MSINEEFIPLEMELYELDNYLAIAQARFVDAIYFAAEISADTESCCIPPLIIQPLVENVVCHEGTVVDNRKVPLRILQGGRLSVSVSNQSRGFPLKVLSALNDPATRRYSGMFNVSRRLVSIYGTERRLQVTSTSQGSTVSFSIPILPPGLWQGVQPLKIAVIDDEKYSREELIRQILLVLPDAAVVQAGSGIEAMELIERELFDLLFVDIRLGGMIGTAIASLARQLLPQAQIVFATVYSEYGVKAFELGVGNYILKPFGPIRVRQVLIQCQATHLVQKPISSAPVQKIAVTANHYTTLMDAVSMVYVETSRTERHCIIHTLDKATYPTALPLSSCENKLSAFGLFRIHKICLAHLLIQDIFSWSNNEFGLRMQGFFSALPIGRNRVKTLWQLLNLQFLSHHTSAYAIRF